MGVGQPQKQAFRLTGSCQRIRRRFRVRQIIGSVPVQVGVEIAALFELIELGAADEKPPWHRPYLLRARWLRMRSRDVDACDGVTRCL
jgi:hypothetical protein